LCGLITKFCVQTAVNKRVIEKWKESSGNGADWEKCIEEGKVHVGL